MKNQFRAFSEHFHLSQYHSVKLMEKLTETDEKLSKGSDIKYQKAVLAELKQEADMRILKIVSQLGMAEKRMDNFIASNSDLSDGWLWGKKVEKSAKRTYGKDVTESPESSFVNGDDL